MPISPEIQLERRRKLLSKTREMIREVGIDGLNVRELAKFCGISVPTLYNQFKNKDDLVVSAADEIFRWHFEKMALPDKDRSIKTILYISDSTVEVILKNPELSKLLVRSMSPSRNSMSLASKLYEDVLRDMQKNGEIEDWVRAGLLGRSLYDRIRSVSIAWAVGRFEDDLLNPMRRCEIALALLGVATGDVREELKALYLEEAPKITF